MSDQTINGLLAVILGTGLAALLVIPVAALQYRRRGRLSVSDLLVLLAGAVYGLALWTYTLLPLPAEGFTCVGRQTDPLATIRAIRPTEGGWASLVRDAAFLQVALNAALFVPLGYFVRRVLGHGVVVATCLGFTVSLLIEVTQTTGIFGVYRCAYRLFDVDDLLVNTLGATAGSVIALLLVREHDGPRALPTALTTGRRWMGMACDVLFVIVLGAVVAVGYRAWGLYLAEMEVSDLDVTLQAALQWGVPGAIETIAVLGFGRTVGEWVVSIRAVPRRPGALIVSRIAKLASGVGVFLALGWATPAWTTPALLAFAALSLLAAWRTKQHRGLTGVISGSDLEVVRSV
ncbi:VanZ family protein [Nocardioides dubius]|uniref:VanZ-like domain-containing protein n=1 Tax=Nocardioides dubius TaxID=317019 RepID=A0ABP4EDF0_9ACTN